MQHRLLVAICACGFVLLAVGHLQAAAPAAGAILWKQQFGSARPDGISRLAVDPAGNVIAFGSTAGAMAGASAGGTDVFVAKYSAAGSQTWVRQLGVGQDDKPIGLAVGSTSEIVIAGSIGGPSQWFLAKYNSGGALLWKRTFTAAAPGTIALTSGGLIISVASAGDYLEQYSSTGTLLWHRPITDAGFAAACCLVIDRSGDIIVGGKDESQLSGHVAKFSAGGSLLWRSDFGGFEGSLATGVATDATGNVVAVGPADVTNADGVYDHFDALAKWPPDGGGINGPAMVWLKTTALSRPTGVAVNAAGDIFISSSAPIYSQSGPDAVVTAIGGDRTQRWRALYGSAGTDYANAIAVGPGNVLYVGGWTNGAVSGTQKGGGDAFLLKLSQQ